MAKDEAVDLSYAAALGAERVRCLDAVEEAVIALEDDERLNAGFGAVLNREGTLELDAAITDGKRSGAVACVTVRHPVSLARRVMETTPHILMVGAGAMALAHDLEVLDDTSDAQRRRWEEARASGQLTTERYGSPEQVDTVGAVALDDSGGLAAATSTGGVLGKLPGRVGDSPLLGAGLYVNERAAVVGTGVGEVFIASLASYRAAQLIAEGATPQDACDQVIAALGDRNEAAAGLLALDREGRVGCSFRGGALPVARPEGAFTPNRLA